MSPQEAPDNLNSAGGLRDDFFNNSNLVGGTTSYENNQGVFGQSQTGQTSGPLLANNRETKNSTVILP